MSSARQSQRARAERAFRNPLGADGKDPSDGWVRLAPHRYVLHIGGVLVALERVGRRYVATSRELGISRKNALGRTLERAQLDVEKLALRGARDLVVRLFGMRDGGAVTADDERILLVCPTLGGGAEVMVREGGVQVVTLRIGTAQCDTIGSSLLGVGVSERRSSSVL